MVGPLIEDQSRGITDLPGYGGIVNLGPQGLIVMHVLKDRIIGKAIRILRYPFHLGIQR